MKVKLKNLITIDNFPVCVISYNVSFKLLYFFSCNFFYKYVFFILWAWGPFMIDRDGDIALVNLWALEPCDGDIALVNLGALEPCDGDIALLNLRALAP